jgi:hypothetical protein
MRFRLKFNGVDPYTGQESLYQIIINAETEQEAQQIAADLYQATNIEVIND